MKVETFPSYFPELLTDLLGAIDPNSFIIGKKSTNHPKENVYHDNLRLIFLIFLV